MWWYYRMGKVSEYLLGLITKQVKDKGIAEGDVGSEDSLRSVRCLD
jgi:hypothetical protein